MGDFQKKCGRDGGEISLSWRWKWFSRRHMAEQQTGRLIFFNEDTRKKKFHFPLWSFVNIESLSAAAVAGQM